MPDKAKKALKKQAKKKGLKKGTPEYKRYVWGTLQKMK